MLARSGSLPCIFEMNHCFILLYNQGRRLCPREISFGVDEAILMFDANILLFVVIASVSFGFLTGYVVHGFLRKETRQTHRVEKSASKDLEISKVSKPAPIRAQTRSRPDVSKSESKFVGPEPNQPPKLDLNPVNIFTKAMQSDVKTPATHPESMVTQVDSILQEKLDLAGMQELAIRLAESPRRGMVVMVGLEQYRGIEEVPYEKVRTMIRESVSEWEQRASSGVLLQ